MQSESVEEGDGTFGKPSGKPEPQSNAKHAANNSTSVYYWTLCRLQNLTIHFLLVSNDELQQLNRVYATASIIAATHNHPDIQHSPK